MPLNVVEYRALLPQWGLMHTPAFNTTTGIGISQSAISASDQSQSFVLNRNGTAAIEALNVSRLSKFRIMVVGRNIDNSTGTVRFYGHHRTGPAHFIGSATFVLSDFPSPTVSPGPSFIADSIIDAKIRSAFGSSGMNDIVNGTFDADTNWNKNAAWTIAAGVATAAAVAVDLGQTVDPLSSNTAYSVTFTLSGITGGSIRAMLGTTVGTTRSTNGTFTETIVSNGPAFTMDVVTAFTGNVDNVSAKQLPAADGSGSQLWRTADAFSITNNEGSTVITKTEVADAASYLLLDLLDSQYTYVESKITLDGTVPATQAGMIYFPVAYRERSGARVTTA